MSEHINELRRLADLMEAWDRFELGMQPPAPMCGNVEAPKLRTSADYVASLEALVRELAKGVVAVRDLMAESGGVYDLHLNGDPSPWDELTEGGRFEAWRINYSAADATLSHPLVAELTKTEDGE